MSSLLDSFYMLLAASVLNVNLPSAAFPWLG